MIRPNGVGLARQEHMRVRLFLTATLLFGSAGPLAGQPVPMVYIADADDCPVRLESARLETGSASGLRIKYLVHNPQRKVATHLVLTAATVDRDDRVTSVRIQTVDEPIQGRTRSEQFVVFPKLVPIAGERLVVGVQAVRWERGGEWRGVVRLASAAAVSVSR